MFISAEQKLRIPKLIDKAALVDERVSMMYLSLLYLALADSYKVLFFFLLLSLFCSSFLFFLFLF